MRVVLLLVLGAGLVWFVWRGVGPGRQPAEGEAQAAAPGAMITLEAPRADATPTSDAAREPVPTPNRPLPPPEVAPAAGEAASPQASAPSTTEPANGSRSPTTTASSPAVSALAISSGSAAASPAEIAAAEELLRDPASLASWLAARGVDLPPGRREFAAGLVHAFAARATDANGALDRAAPTGEVQPSERELVRRIASSEAASTTIESTSPLARAASMKAHERAALEHLAAGRAREAAEILSRLLLAEIASPWRADAGRLGIWSERLHEAQRGNRWNRRGNWRSSEVIVEPGDSLISVRKRALANDPNLVVCTGQIARANQLAGEIIHPGAKLRIPLERVSVLVDLDAHWAFYLASDEVVAAWPIGVGKEDSATRTGAFQVGKKLKEPMWFPAGRKPVPYGAPENPLGTRWIEWNDIEGKPTHLGFHGTNEPGSIGRDGSLGCIRMRTEDVEELFEILPVGASVQVNP